jgi:hypothetical protein
MSKAGYHRRMSRRRRMSYGLVAVAALLACSPDEERNDRFRGHGGGGSDATSTTTSAGPGGGGGATSSSTGPTSSSTSASSSSAGGACTDPFPEPNDTEADAVYLGAIDDCDSSAAMLEGVLAGDDVDWWTYDGIDGNCIVDADRQFSSMGGSIRVCKYFDCPGVVVTCPNGTSPDNSPDQGLPGCCSQAGFNVAPDCNGLDDSSYVFIRVDKQPIDDCVGYALAYHY